MSSEFREKEERIERLRLDNEEADQEVSLSQKKALIKEAKSKYGRDWKKVLGLVGKVRLNKETLMDLHSMGMDGGQELRNLNNPFRKKSGGIVE